MPQIDLINVTKRWGDFYAVDNLNLHMDDCSFITLLGPSGCGKTTTLRMIAGLETPTSGKILINGVPVFDSDLGINVPASKRHVGFLFQNYALWPHMTVQKNIEFGLQNLKEAMPLVDSKYTQLKDLKRVLENPEKVVELLKINRTKEGKVDERRALIAIIDNFKVSMFTANDVYKFHFENGIDQNKINERISSIDQELEKIKNKYEDDTLTILEDGNIIGDAELADDYISSKIYLDALTSFDKTLDAILESEKANVKPIEKVMKTYNSSTQTAKKIVSFVTSIKDKENKEELLKEELENVKEVIEGIKRDYYNNGFYINEKGEKIPSIDYENKEWDKKRVHIIKVRKLDKEEIDLRVRHVSRVVKIGEFMDRYPSELSGGQQQRVAIARTLAPGPKVLFMDEPLSNLDAKLRLEMRGELKRLHLETGSTFVYVTHDQTEAMTMATKICLINNGVLQQYAAPLDVYKKPNNLFVADFVGNPAINFVEVLASQNANDIDLTMFNGINFKFKPAEEINLEALRKERDEEIEKKNQENEALKQNKKFVLKGNKDESFDFKIAKVSGTLSSKEERDVPENEYVIGIRPEFISLNDTSELEGEIYNALPSGMETTVKIRLNEFILTSVIFGGVDYKIGSKCKINFIGKEILLFDRKSGKLLASGSLELAK